MFPNSLELSRVELGFAALDGQSVFLEMFCDLRGRFKCVNAVMAVRRKRLFPLSQRLRAEGGNKMLGLPDARHV